MSETPQDQGADTQMFQKFVDAGPEPSSPKRTMIAMIVGGVVLLLLVVLMFVLLR